MQMFMIDGLELSTLRPVSRTWVDDDTVTAAAVAANGAAVMWIAHAPSDGVGNFHRAYEVAGLPEDVVLSSSVCWPPKGQCLVTKGNSEVTSGAQHVIVSLSPNSIVAVQFKPRNVPVHFAAQAKTDMEETKHTAPLSVGNASQPVWRDGLFASMTTIGTLNAPAFDSVVLQAAHLPLAAWEAGFTVETLGTNVVRDPASGKIRMYYTLRWAALDEHGVPVTHTHPQPNMFMIAMAESDDGVTFTKPALPSKPFNSSLNKVNVSASNIICHDECLSSIWVTDKGPTPHKWWGAAGSGGDRLKIWNSADGIEWDVFGLVSIPDLDGMRGLDTMQVRQHSLQRPLINLPCSPFARPLSCSSDHSVDMPILAVHVLRPWVWMPCTLHPAVVRTLTWQLHRGLQDGETRVNRPGHARCQFCHQAGDRVTS